jgi:hypothetical protein
MELNALRPDNARALDGLTPGEKSALERLHRNGLVCEGAIGLWWLHPIAWDERLDAYFHRQLWIFAVVAAVAVVLIWLQYLY